MMHDPVFLSVGLPILCVTAIILVSILKKGERRDRKRERRNRSGSLSDDDALQMEELYYELKDLNKRIENLETIIKERR